MSTRPMVNPRARKRACRVMRNLTVSPRTEDALTLLAARTGLSRGRIVDLALANVQACPTCDGWAALDSGKGAPCVLCAATGLVPGSDR